jgi:hypothetical protein
VSGLKGPDVATIGSKPENPRKELLDVVPCRLAVAEYRRRDMAGFIQFVEFEATDVHEIEAALERFRDEHPGVLTALSSTITEDRDRPGTYISIVEFPSYEKAMEQQSNPAAPEFSASLAKLMSGPPRFRNLDVRSVLTDP